MSDKPDWWPMEIRPRDVLLPQFRQPRYLKIDEPRPSRRSQRPGMSPQHLVHIRLLACACCYVRQGIEAHHLKSGPARRERGVGLKATDRWTLPLCGGPLGHHADLERYGSRREEEWFAEFGIDPHALAIGLWNRRGNVDNMRAVLEAHKRSAILVLSQRRPGVRNGVRS